MREAFLQGAHLGKAYLQDVNLAGAQMQGAKLLITELQGANLEWAQLQGAILLSANLQGSNLQGVNLRGTNLREANLQGANLRGAQLQGASLNEVKLQGANLSGTDLQGTNLYNAQLLNNIEQSQLNGVFIGNTSKLSWSKEKQQTLEKTLRMLWDKDRLIEFQETMKNIRQQLSPEMPAGCYSENPKLLECEYSKNEELDIYRINLHAYLIKLACSDRAIAEGIAKRSLDPNSPDFNSPDLGLATALLKELDTAEPCMGLNTLSQEIRQELQEEVTRQQALAP